MKESEYIALANNLPAVVTEEDLKELAEKLPKTVVEVKARIPGRKLRKICAVGDRKKVVPSKMYTYLVPHDTDNYTAIMAVYKQNGVAGVKNFLREFLPHHKRMMQKYPHLMR